MSEQSLSELIKKARENHGLTQTAFGTFFEPTIAQPTIARWEKGDLLPNRKHFPKIASFLDISLDEFYELIRHQLNEEGITISSSDEKTYAPNKRHLNTLNKGVKSWNRWKEKNPRVIAQLSGAHPKEDYLDRIDLSNAELEGAFFSGKFLREAQFDYANLADADLKGVDLRNSNLIQANLARANLSGANLSNANLWGANLSEAILTNAILKRANLEDANLEYADLSYADIRGANLNQANLEYSVIKHCYIYGISDWNANLSYAVQKKLSICPHKVEPIYVDCIENARYKLLEINSIETSEIHKYACEIQKVIQKNRTSFKEKLENFKKSNWSYK